MFHLYQNWQFMYINAYIEIEMMSSGVYCFYTILKRTRKTVSILKGVRFASKMLHVKMKSAKLYKEVKKNLVKKKSFPTYRLPTQISLGM